jgi:hypothetical protein
MAIARGSQTFILGDLKIMHSEMRLSDGLSSMAV